MDGRWPLETAMVSAAEALKTALAMINGLSETCERQGLVGKGEKGRPVADKDNLTKMVVSNYVGYFGKSPSKYRLDKLMPIVLEYATGTSVRDLKKRIRKALDSCSEHENLNLVKRGSIKKK